MEDNQIIELYWNRSEEAIERTDEKYGSYCRRIAYNILLDINDSQECVNDTYLRAWNTIPPQRPNKLSAFLGKITRNLSIDRLKFMKAEKRGYGQIPLVLEELENVLSSGDSVEKDFQESQVVDAINRFLETLSVKDRKAFVLRYWYVESVRDIGKKLDMKENTLNSLLFRLRRDLKDFLEKEGLWI